jgi:hypothetical protein
MINSQDFSDDYINTISYSKLSEKCSLFVQDEISKNLESFASFDSLWIKYLSWHKSCYTTKVESRQEIQNIFMYCWGPLKNKGWYGIEFTDDKFSIPTISF